MAAVSQEAKDRQTKGRKELVAMYKEHGICPRCKNWSEPGRVYCKNCMKKIRAKQKLRDPTGEIHRQYCRDRRKRLKEAGLCVHCGKKLAIAGQVLCKECNAKNRESQIVYNINRRLKREEEKARGALNGQGNGT